MSPCNVESWLDHLSGSRSGSVFRIFIKLSEIADDNWFRRMIFERCVYDSFPSFYLGFHLVFEL